MKSGPGVRPPPSVEAALARVMKGEYEIGQPRVPFALVAIGEGSQRVAQHAIDQLRFGVGVFVAGRANEKARHRPMRRVNYLNSALVNLGHVRDPVTGAECHLEDDPGIVRPRFGRAHAAWTVQEK